MCDWITEKSEKLEMDDLAKDLTTVKELQSKAILLFSLLGFPGASQNTFFMACCHIWLKRMLQAHFLR